MKAIVGQGLKLRQIYIKIVFALYAPAISNGTLLAAWF